MTGKRSTILRHTIKLRGFEFESGKISLAFLSQLNDHLVRLAESSLMSLVTGNSTIKRGKSADWLERSLDFHLTGIREGSTILQIDAPALHKTLGNLQIPMFFDAPIEELTNNSALGLGFHLFVEAIDGDLNSPILDKHLLAEMRSFGKFLKKKGSSIEFSSGKRSKHVKLQKETIDKIRIIEEQTPASIKTKVTGILDMLKHSNHQLELIVDDTKRIRATLSDRLNIAQLTNLFGKKVTATGIANYNPSGAIISFEISGVKAFEMNAPYFNQLPQPMFEETNLQRIIKSQNYKGYKSNKVEKLIAELNVEESLEELLSALKSSS